MPDQNNNPHRFAPESHFFTDPSAIAQISGQAFGPVSADIFRLTSKFTVTGTPKAFAICQGVVFVQPQTGSTDKVNVILRPLAQPIQGVNIKYFVYRGLLKSDFVDGANIIASTSFTSDLINRMNTDFSDFHADEEEMPVFEARFIGYDPTNQTDGTTLLDTFFFNRAQYEEVDEETVEVESTAFVLPKANFGDSIGTFATGECGIDVVLQYGDYVLTGDPSHFTFDLDYARAAEAKVDLTGITDEVLRKLKKELIFQFVDVAAYFGFHHTDNGKVTVDNSVTKTVLPVADIYTTSLAPFYTKNNYYLYIQSDRTRSYNFYGNYLLDPEDTESLLFGIEEETLIARDYATSGWPLIIESTAQEHEEDRNKLFLQLVTDNNVNTVLYGQTACVDSGVRNHFANSETLRTPADEDGNLINLTTTIVLSNPCVEESGVKKHVGNFGMLLYQGVVYQYIAGTELDEEEEEVDVYAVPNFFDDVFGQLLAEPVIQSDSAVSYSVMVSERLKLVNHYSNYKQLGTSAVQTLIINDSIETDDDEDPISERVTYLLETVDVSTNALYPFKNPSTKVPTTPNIAGNTKKNYKFSSPYFVMTISFTDSMNPINGLLLHTDDGSQTTKIAIGISKTENDLLSTLSSSNNLVNPRIFLIDLFSDNNTLISAELVKYKKFKLSLVGESEDGKLLLFIIDPGILIYTIDDRYHFSQAYSKHVKSNIPFALSLSGINKLYGFNGLTV